MSFNVPDEPVIPYIEGDGIGVDITPVMLKLVDAAVIKAYGGAKKTHWMEVYAGEKAAQVYGPDVWRPEETLAALKELVVPIKGPLTTPVGGGILAAEEARENKPGHRPRELGRHPRGHRVRGRKRHVNARIARTLCANSPAKSPHLAGFFHGGQDSVKRCFGASSA